MATPCRSQLIYWNAQKVVILMWFNATCYQAVYLSGLVANYQVYVITASLNCCS